jgi:ABC-type multidrug transport system fused ATPase/permease subunit
MEVASRLEIRDLAYSYVNDPETPVLKNINLTINQPGIYGVVGGSGSGKSTLGLILAGLIEPDSGEILVNHSQTRSALLNTMTSYTFQDEGLLPGGLIQNITLEEKVSRIQDYQHCLKMALIEDEVDWNVRIRQLSDGQRQRICLARALYRNRPILVLDEGTSSLDNTSELKILQNLRNQAPDKIVIVITHRPELMERCDRIFKISDHTLNEVSYL